MKLSHNSNDDISRWCAENGYDLKIESSDSHRRYFYIPYESGNLFQVVFEPEDSGIRRVDIHLIESFNDREFHSYVLTQVENIKDVVVLLKKYADLWNENF